MIPNIHNFTGKVLTVRGLEQVQSLMVDAAKSDRPQFGWVEVNKGPSIWVQASPNGMVTQSIQPK